MDENKKKDLEKQGYRIVGNHSAIKVCHWTKRAIRGEDVCYKCTFYGIITHKCVQMTPALPFCNHRCSWCWRDVDFTKMQWQGPVDDPKDIVDGCIEAHIKYIQGFGGTEKTDKKNYEEAQQPLHFAISLSGEPTMYPRLNEMIDYLKEKKMTSFLVTNGTNPEVLENLKGHEPTQLYITLPAPDEETYVKSCSPLIKDGWQRILQSLKIIDNLKTRKTIRLTLVKDVNMIHPEKYAELFKDIDADFFELKGYVWVGYSRERLANENMPRHSEIMEFANEIIKHNPELKIIDVKENSRVVLLAREDAKDRVMNFDNN